MYIYPHVVSVALKCRTEPLTTGTAFYELCSDCIKEPKQELKIMAERYIRGHTNMGKRRLNTHWAAELIVMFSSLMNKYV